MFSVQSLTSSCHYNTLNRLDQLVHFVDANSDGIYDGPAGGETMVASFDYTLDTAGNRISATQMVDGHLP